jgi:hypothetical protein
MICCNYLLSVVNSRSVDRIVARRSVQFLKEIWSSQTGLCVQYDVRKKI